MDTLKEYLIEKIKYYSYCVECAENENDTAEIVENKAALYAYQDIISKLEVD